MRPEDIAHPGTAVVTSTGYCLSYSGRGMKKKCLRLLAPLVLRDLTSGKAI